MSAEESADRRRAVRNGEKFYSTYCIYPDGEAVTNKFFTKEENDGFAEGLELMGVKEITKSFYNPAMRVWIRYHSRSDVQALNRQSMNVLYRNHRFEPGKKE